ncbi:MAG: hypothetical protein D6732_12710 [Methanobacteriota archaeon]|nr:MAG: hypothetical protein D6732_12710 [Euryarchaeota archaeon]
MKSEWDILKEKFQQHYAPVIREKNDLKAFDETMKILEGLKERFLKQEKILTQKEAMQVFLYTLMVEAFKRIDRLERRSVHGKNPENL